MNIVTPSLHRITNHLAILSKSHLIQMVMVLMIAFNLQGCGDVNADEQAVSMHYLQAKNDYLVQQDSYQVDRKFVGKVVAKQDANLGFELAGRVNDLLVIEGQKVTKGQVLAALDTELLVIERAQLEAQLQQAQAEFDLTDANLKRVSSLIDSGFTSAQSMDELTSKKRVIAANIRSTRSALDASQYQIDKSKLVAPFDGIVGKRLIAEGEVIASGTPAFRLSQSGHSEITVGVPATFVDQLEGHQHEVQIAGKSYPVTLLTKGSEVNEITRTVSLRFALPKQNGIYHGQLAYLKLSQEYQARGYWVPLSAITDGVRGMWNIYTLEETSPAIFTLNSSTVTVLHATETAAYVQGDLKDHQAFVTTGLHRFVPGQQVKTSVSADVAKHIAKQG